MNLTKKIIDIDDKYTMYFDMESIVTYQDSGKSFYAGYSELIKFKDSEILDFIACTLRDKTKGEKPVGFDFVKSNPLYFLERFGGAVIVLIASSFEEKEEDNSKKH